MELDLKEIRNQLDTIDDQMIALFSQRMQLVAKVAAYKKEKGMPILDAGREQQIIDRLAEKAGKDMAEDTAQLYQMIFSLSRAYQARKIEEMA